MKSICIFLTGLLISVQAYGVVLKGSVSDELGNPVKNTPVYLIMKKKTFSIKQFKSEIVDSKTVVAYTDENGLYELDIDIDPYFNKFYLYFYGDGFSFAHYNKPEPETLGSRIKREEGIVVNRVFEISEDWDKIQIAVSSLDKSSEKYIALMTYGFPDKRDILDDSREKWYYYKLDREIIIEN